MCINLFTLLRVRPASFCHISISFLPLPCLLFSVQILTEIPTIKHRVTQCASAAEMTNSRLAHLHHDTGVGCSISYANITVIRQELQCAHRNDSD